MVTAEMSMDYLRDHVESSQNVLKNAGEKAVYGVLTDTTALVHPFECLHFV